ncbi:MAG: GAF domain-containing protein [Armatimonadetes bacterium]|nr:GAF domain-containing protein [Armatimonadota bacterium]
MPDIDELRAQRIEQRFEALRQLSLLIARSGDVAEFAVALAGQLCSTFDAGAASLVLVDPLTDELVFHTANGATGALLNEARLKRGEGIAGWVCQHHQGVNVPQARDDARFCARVDQITGFYTRSVLCAPLYRSGQVEGAVQVLNHNSGGAFAEDDLAFLELIAEQVELLVANAKLITGLQQRNRELTTLIDIDRAVNAVPQISDLLHTIVRAAADVTQAGGCSVILVDPDTSRLTFFQAVGPAGGQLLDITMDPGSGVVGYCIERGESVYVPNAYEDERFLARVDAATGFHTQSILAVPLRTARGVLGALELVNVPAQEDVRGLVSLMEAFASQTALALERARLNERLERRVDLANERLRETNRSLAIEKLKLTGMIGQMADGVIMIDADGVLLLVNDAASRIFALQNEVLEGRPALDVQSVGLAAALAVGDTQPGGQELRLEGPPARVLRVHGATVRSEDGVRIGRVVVCTDITSLIELAQMRTDLVSFVSHELRTPLTSIKGLTGALLADARIDLPDLRSILRMVDHECDRLRRLVSDLLCMSRLESGLAVQVAWQRLDLVDLLRHTAETQAIYSPDHRIELRLPAERLVVEADDDKLEQIFTNLVNNALKYSPAGTTVTVELVSEGPFAVTRVTDEGYGIAAEDLPSLFQQYGRLPDAERRSIRGTGLGLYLTKHLVEAHGGTIEVASEVGRGSTFTVTLPRRRPWGET